MGPAGPADWLIQVPFGNIKLAARGRGTCCREVMGTIVNADAVDRLWRQPLTILQPLFNSHETWSVA